MSTYQQQLDQLGLAADTDISTLTQQLAASQSSLTASAAQVAQLQAQLAAAMTAAAPVPSRLYAPYPWPTSGPIHLPAGVVLLAPDFVAPSNDPVYAAYEPTGVTMIDGAGKDITVVAPTPNTMSAATQAEAKVTTGTNQIRALRVDDAALSNFTLQAVPEEGCNYGGIQIYQGAPGLTHTNVAVRGFQGSASAPPGEIFHWDITRTNDARFVNVDLDGKDVNGNHVGATLLGLNYVVGFTATGGIWCDSKYGYAASSYHGSGNITYRGVKVVGCLGAFNFEQNAANVVIDKCDFGGNVYTYANGAHIILDSLVGSSKVVISDPVGSPVVKVKLHANYTDIATGASGANVQQRSDITVTVNGQVRPDLLAFV